MNESAVGRFYRDAKILEIGEGTSEVQWMIIARVRRYQSLIATSGCVLVEQLGDVDDSHVVLFATRPEHRIVDHDLAVRTCRRDDVGTRRQRLVGPVEIDPGTDRLLHPHPRATRSATKASLTTAMPISIGGRLVEARTTVRGSSKKRLCRPR